MNLEGALESVAVGGLTITAAVLAAISWAAWRERRSPKVMFLAFGFTFFLAKSVVLSVALFWPSALPEDILLPIVLFDLAILAAFYAAVVLRARP